MVKAGIPALDAGERSSEGGAAGVSLPFSLGVSVGARVTPLPPSDSGDLTIFRRSISSNARVSVPQAPTELTP